AEGGNAKAMRLLTEGFKNKPPVFYYQGGDDPELPKALKGAITAELLAPAPKDSGGEFSGTDNKKEQYLAAASDEGLPETEAFSRLEKEWPATANDYPSAAFRAYRTQEQIDRREDGSPAALEAVIKSAQPDTMLAVADALDGTLNNQSLVVLFTCQGKKLLFVGDAQWGNWSYWLYGKKVTGADPGITENAKQILGSIGFQQVGQQWNTKGNPNPGVGGIDQELRRMVPDGSGSLRNPKERT